MQGIYKRGVSNYRIAGVPAGWVHPSYGEGEAQNAYVSHRRLAKLMKITPLTRLRPIQGDRWDTPGLLRSGEQSFSPCH